MWKFFMVLVLGLMFFGAGCVEEAKKPLACTADAKICPDGSSVGRIPPDCNFAPCPGSEPAHSSTETPIANTPPPQHYPKTPTPTFQPVCSDGEVKNATCPDGVTIYASENCVDGRWFTINYFRDPCSPLPTAEPQKNNHWVEIAPIQCLGNPWEQDWLSAHNNDFSGYPKDKEFDVIKDYYKKQGINILDAKLISFSEKYGEPVAVCLACSCPRGDTLYLLVSESDVNRMVELGYTVSIGM